MKLLEITSEEVLMFYAKIENRLTNYEKILCAAIQGSFTVVSLMFPYFGQLQATRSKDKR